MSNDFWAGYLSGAIGIVIGNPLDLVKTRLQAGQVISGSLGSPQSIRSHFDTATSLVRGATAPILGYGALNAILFVAYNRTLMGISPHPVPDPTDPVGVPLSHIWLAGAVGGLASWVISSPTELVKCRAQLATHDSISTWSVTKDILRRTGLKGLYYGGGVTSVRDSTKLPIRQLQEYFSAVALPALSLGLQYFRSTLLKQGFKLKDRHAPFSLAFRQKGRPSYNLQWGRRGILSWLRVGDI
ncbi:hypothetical protein FQN52_003210 [Onygenales sp. PD_12]|nr:hypothetical protein FQN52_003210 [Onygenales sp. PD_12]